MSTTYVVTGLGKTAVSTHHLSSFIKQHWDAFQERRKRERVRADLYGLKDWELKDIGIARGDRLRGLELRYRPARHPIRR
jgi:uncharacterized protein YjiS (DUF1127 family)